METRNQNVTPQIPDPFLIDDENPEWTEEDFRTARPAYEIHPELVKAFAALREKRFSELLSTKNDDKN